MACLTLRPPVRAQTVLIRRYVACAPGAKDEKRGRHASILPYYTIPCRTTPADNLVLRFWPLSRSHAISTTLVSSLFCTMCRPKEMPNGVFRPPCFLCYFDFVVSCWAQRLLDANGKLEEGDRVWLSRLRGIMSVSQFEGERALESVTAPIYRCMRVNATPVLCRKTRSTCIINQGSGAAV